MVIFILPHMNFVEKAENPSSNARILPGHVEGGIFLIGSIRKLDINDLYQPPRAVGSHDAFQIKNLALSVREVSQEEFIQHIFGDFSGYICIFQKRSDGQARNVFYDKRNEERMQEFIKKTFGMDTYIAYSTFYRKDRKIKGETLRTQSNIVKTYMLVQDLDYYKMEMNDAEFLQKLGEMIRGGDIVCPSYIISTGRGYQLVWLVEPFTNIAGYTHDKDWCLLQEHFYQALKPFNPDTVVKNPSAVTRLPGTRHRSTGNRVHAYLANQVVFKLKDLLFYHGLVPNSDRKVTPKKRVKPDNKVTRMVETWNEFTLNRQREEDIFIFVHEQNKRKESYIGIRNWMALVLRFHAIVSSGGDIDYARNRVLELCDEMDMTDTSVAEILRRSQPAETYYEEWLNDTWDKKKYVRGGLFYTNKRILELMDIQDDYYLQWKMKTIKIKNKKYEAARKHFERLEKGQIKGSMQDYNERRADQKEDKLEQLRQLLAENPKMKQKELAEKLEITQPRVSQLKKQL